MNISGNIAIHTAASQTSLVKTFSGSDWNVRPFKIDKVFNCSEKSISDLQNLFKSMQSLENEIEW